MAEHRTSKLSPNSRPTPAGPRPLRWKVVGTARDGQMIEIFSPRLTIGSGPECTFRLRSKGVGSLQCLIVRESRGPVARSLSVDTWLNGQRFREELLHTGDRLKLGSIELELCDDGRAILPTRADMAAPARTPAKPELSSWIETKSLRPIEVLARIERLEEKFQQLRDVEQTSASRTATANLDSLPTYQDSCVPSVVAANTAEPRTVPSAVLAERERLISELERSNQQHQQAQIEFARLQTERDALQSRCDELAQSQRAAQDWLQSLQAELERQGQASQAVLKNQRRDWELHQTTVLHESQRFQDTLAQLVEKQTAANRTLAHLEQSLETERQQRGVFEQRLEQQAAKVAELQAQCDSLNASMLAQRSRPTVPAAPSGQPILPTPTEGNEYGEDSTRTEARGFASRREQRDWLAQQVSNVGLQPDSCGDEPELSYPTEQPNLQGEPHLHPAENAGSENAGSDTQSADENLRTEHRIMPAISAAQERARIDDDPVTSDVFSRLSRAGIWKDPEHPGTSGIESRSASENESSLSSPRAHNVTCWPEHQQPFYEPVRAQSGLANNEHLLVAATSQDGQEQVAEPAPALRTHGQENSPVTEVSVASNAGSEESIELYMQQLLQRVRGDSAAPETSLQAFFPDADRSPQTEVKLPVTTKGSEPQTAVLTESEYQPRSQAPEMGANFAAMREIGNDSRKKNIMKHAQRTWTDKTRTRLFGSVAGLALAFASFFYLDTNPESAAIGLFAGFSVAGFWLWQAFHCRKQLFNSIRLNVEEIEAAEQIGAETADSNLDPETVQ